MSKYWRIGSREDTLAYYVLAPNREMAVKVVEDMMGPQNPSRRVVTELANAPLGYVAEGSDPQILVESEDE